VADSNPHYIDEIGPSIALSENVLDKLFAAAKF
jgi:hypothetical protein